MRGQTNESILDPKLQRKLRNNPTDAEQRLWSVLRRRQLDGCKFRRQHPYYGFILDFVCMERKVVVEVDGGQHAGSVRDADRDEFLRKGGFVVLRFWNHDVLRDAEAVANEIHRILQTRDATHHPHPSPPLEGEGEEPR
jgi:very-short-patch-repair endonuclease